MSKLEFLSVKRIREIAGPWDNILSHELNKHALGLPYDGLKFRKAINHLETFYAPQIASFYKHVLYRENEINDE